MIEKVVIVGGTHGNERTGIALLARYQQQPLLIARPGLRSECLLANPRATEQNRRYLERDLNRCFSQADLENTELSLAEELRAQALQAELGPKQQPHFDYVFDLHTTTANMGVSLIMDDDSWLTRALAFYIDAAMPGECHLFYEPSERLSDPFLVSMGRLGGLIIEVGPVPQGLLRYDSYDKSHRALMHGLDFLSRYHLGQLPSLPEQRPGYQFVRKYPFPQQQGQPLAMIHPDFQDQDYQPLRLGQPIFKDLNGQDLLWQESGDYVAAFINEAAYYDRLDAFSLLRPVTLTLPPQAQNDQGLSPPA